MKRIVSVVLAALMLLGVLPFSVFAEGEVRSVRSYEEMTAFVRGELTARSETVRFRYDGSDYRAPTLDDLCAWGGDAHAGDYLRLSFRTMPKTVEENGVYTVSASFYTDAGQEAAVDAYVEDALAACPDGTDYEKAEYIYNYLCENVLFDLENLNNEQDLLKYTAYGAAVNGRAVCQGFSTLFYRLALAAGIDCRIVTGTRSGVKHAWNIVKWDGKWYHVDASSGSQLSDPSCYFMTGLPLSYTIRYGSFTDPAIRDYTFAPSDEDIVTGAVNYQISYTLNKTTGLLTVAGTGEIPAGRELFSGVSGGFAGCVRTVVFEEGITGVALGEFLGRCEGYMEEIRIPASMMDISAVDERLRHSPYGSSYAKLCSVVVADANPAYRMDGNCLIDVEAKSVVLGFQNAVIPADGSVTSIGDYAFYGAPLSAIEIPDTVTAIGGYAFAYTPLSSVFLPDSLTSVGDYAFIGSKLTQVTIGADMSAELPPTVFHFCNNLEKISVEDGSLYYKTDAKGVLYSADGAALIRYPAALAGRSYEIPEGVTEIRSTAFANSQISAVEIPESVTEIGEGAFMHCKNLSGVSLPAGLTRISDSAFYNTGLKGIEIPEGVTEIGKEAFSNCKSLRRAELPESLTKIGDEAFYAASLTEITIPDAVTEIGKLAFENTDISYIVITVGVTEIAYGALATKNLSSVDLPAGLKIIGERAFYWTKLTQVSIPDGVTEIGASAFYNCYQLESVVLPASVASIGNSAFHSLSGVLSVCIYGVAGSYAEQYAAENGIEFREVCPVSMETHNALIVEATEADCTHGAYSAGQKCADCGAWIVEPELTAEPLGHDPAEPVRENVTEPTCTEEGGYDSVIYCARCNEVLSSVYEKLAMVPHADGDRNGYCDECGANICAHEETSIQNQTDASCTENGYSGDTVCDICGVVLEYGATVYTQGHSPVLAAEAIAATCLDPGRTAEYVCSECGAVTTASRQTPTVGHVDADGDGFCDVCLSPVGSEVYGKCGERLFWYVSNGILVISGSGDSYEFDDEVPWSRAAEGIDTVYIREGAGAVDGLSACPALQRIFAPVGASVTGAQVPVAVYEYSGGGARIVGAYEGTLYDLLNTAYFLCIDHEVRSVSFDALTVRTADGQAFIPYDILRGGKIIDENHFDLNDGAVLNGFRMEPTGYGSFNAVLDAVGANPDKNLILRIDCDDLLPAELKADADAYTEQIAVQFVAEDEEKSLADIIAERFKATLAALLALFKKAFKFFKGIFGKK